MSRRKPEDRAIPKIGVDEALAAVPDQTTAERRTMDAMTIAIILAVLCAIFSTASLVYSVRALRALDRIETIRRQLRDLFDDGHDQGGDGDGISDDSEDNRLA